jgi:hypothetical protein
MHIKGVFLGFAIVAGCWYSWPNKEMTGTATQPAQIAKNVSVSIVNQPSGISKVSPKEAGVPAGILTDDIQDPATADLGKEIFGPAKSAVSTPPEVPVAFVQGTAPILFDAELDKRKDLSAYAKTPAPHSGMVVNPHCISVVPDPVFGHRRLVMELNVTNKDTGPTSNPRAQVQTPMQYTEGQEVWAAFSVFFPGDFPNFLSWMTLAEFYGAPYKGTSPFLIGCRMNNLILQHNRLDKPLWEEAIRKGLWYDILYRTVLSKDSAVGEVQVFMRIQGEGPAWREILQGNMATITESNADGPQYHKICNYRSLQGNWQHLDKTGKVTATRIFLGNHRVGAVRAQVEPAYLPI